MSTLSLALILSLIFIFSFSACFYFIWKYDSSKLSKRLSSFTQNSSYTNTDDIDFFKFLYTRLIEPLIQYSLPKKNHDLEKIKKKFIEVKGLKNKQAALEEIKKSLITP